MGLLLLDTTVLIDAERGGLELDRTIGDEDDVAIAAITVAELLVGVRLADSSRHSAREQYVAAVLDSLTTIPYDAHVAAHHAELLVAVRRQGRPRGAHDLVIAATARATGRTLLTGDRSAFADLPGVEMTLHT